MRRFLSRRPRSSNAHSMTSRSFTVLIVSHQGCARLRARIPVWKTSSQFLTQQVRRRGLRPGSGLAGVARRGSRPACGLRRLARRRAGRIAVHGRVASLAPAGTGAHRLARPRRRGTARRGARRPVGVRGCRDRDALSFASAALGRDYGVPRSASGEPRSSSCSAWASSAAASSISPPTSTSCSCIRRAARPTGRAPIANEEYFTRLGQALIRLLDARTAGRLRVPRRHAPAALRRAAARWSRASARSRTTCSSTAATGSATPASRRAPITGVATLPRDCTTASCGRSSTGATSTSACSRACAR